MRGRINGNQPGIQMSRLTMGKQLHVDLISNSQSSRNQVLNHQSESRIRQHPCVGNQHFTSVNHFCLFFMASALLIFFGVLLAFPVVSLSRSKILNSDSNSEEHTLLQVMRRHPKEESNTIFLF